jgi:hypothetical protein
MCFELEFLHFQLRLVKTNFVVQLVEKATVQENNTIFHRQNSKSKSRGKSQLNKASFDSVSNTIANLKTDDSLVILIHPIIVPNNTSK